MHTYTYSHSFTFTVHYSLQSDAPSGTYITHHTVSSRKEVLSVQDNRLETSDTFVWLCVIVCFQVPSRWQAEGRAFVLEGGRVTLVTDMPKPDLLCLVQLLDGTIETFRVSVRKTHTHTRKHTHKHTDTCPFWADYMLLLSARALY